MTIKLFKHNFFHLRINAKLRAESKPADSHWGLSVVLSLSCPLGKPEDNN